MTELTTRTRRTLLGLAGAAALTVLPTATARADDTLDTSVAALITTTGSDTQTAVDGRISTMLTASVVRSNRSSVPRGASSWWPSWGTGGAGTTSISPSGAYVATWTTDATGGTMGISGADTVTKFRVPVKAGEAITVSVDVASNRAACINLDFRDLSFTNVATATSPWAVISNNQAAPTRMYVTATVPADAAFVACSIRINPDASNAELAFLAGDRMLIESGADVLPYLDGETSPLKGFTPSWTGSTNSSPSVISSTLADGLRQSVGTRVGKDQMVLNILDYGAVRGNSASQTDAIRYALDTNPGACFRFPPGDYRLDTTLSITRGNSLILDSGARIYAAAVMDTLVDYDNRGQSVASFTEDASITGGGRIDGALKASDCLHVAAVARFTIQGLTFTDPVHRGLVTGPYGFEINVHDIRLYNTGSTNVADNIAIEANASDSRFYNIVARDFTIGAWDRRSGNVWIDFHPWIGNQTPQRFPGSVGIRCSAYSELYACNMDTFQYSYQTFFDADSGRNYNPKVRVIGCRNTVYGANMTAALAAANPTSVFDLCENSTLMVIGGYFDGPDPAYPAKFATGDTSRFTADYLTNMATARLTGVAAYQGGVVVGSTQWVPCLAGSTTAGSMTYSTPRRGNMVVRDGLVTWQMQVRATVDATAAGDMLITGIPIPKGVAYIGSLMGQIAYDNQPGKFGTVTMSTWDHSAGAGTAKITVPGSRNTFATADSVRSLVVEIWATMTATYQPRTS